MTPTNAQPPDLASRLATAERERELQLASLPSCAGGLVADAYRASVARILADVRGARARLVAGTYGSCAGCAAAIPAERLELRPWTPTCVRCGER